MAAGKQSNAFLTDSTGADYVNPIKWDEDIRKHIYDQETMRFITNVAGKTLVRTDTRYLDVPGKQGNIQIEGGFSVSALTEGTETPVSAYSVTQVNVTFKGYGDAKQFSEEELVYVLRDVKGNLMYNAAGALGENRDDQVITEAMTSTNSYYASGNAHTSANVVAGDVLLAKDIKKLASLMAASGQSTGMGAIVVHPKVAFDLFDDDELNLATGNIMTSERIAMDGYLTSYAGVKIYQHRGIQTATENSITVYKNVVLGNNEPLVFAPKKAPIMEFDNEFARARILTFHYWEMFGVEQVITDSVYVLTSSAS